MVLGETGWMETAHHSFRFFNNKPMIPRKNRPGMLNAANYSDGPALLLVVKVLVFVNGWVFVRMIL